MRPDSAPDLAAARLHEGRTAWLAATHSGELAVDRFAAQLLDRISPPRWQLEWSLPGWLAALFDLSPEVDRTLTLANVLGLAYVRLQDDLLDGDLDPTDASIAVGLCAVLYLEWARRVSAIVGREPLFWDAAREYLQQWAAAIRHCPPAAAVPFDSLTEDDFLRLGRRAAPLKLCIAAACTIAGDPARLPLISRAVDDLMVAAVLIDHAHDWRGDLAAGRNNVYLAYLSPLSQAPGALPQVEQWLLAEWVIGARGEPYFAEIDRRLAAAVRTATDAGLSPLAGRADALAQGVRERRRALSKRIDRELSAARARIFPDDDSGGTPHMEEHNMSKQAEQPENAYPGSEPGKASAAELERLVGRSFMDAEFGSWLMKDPRSAAASIGIPLSDAQVNHILALDDLELLQLAERFRGLVGAEPKWASVW